MEQREHTGSDQHELEHTIQSTQTLIKASIFAVLFGALVLTVFILPAEYDIDPTGLGAALGLTKIASTTPVNPVKPISEPNTFSSVDFQEHTNLVVVPAGSGVEYKLTILKGDGIRYSWKSDGDPLFFDFHGEPKGDTTGYFESYTVSTSYKVRGSFTAGFDGTHGWYWKNNSSSPITVLLKTEGNYELIKK